MAWKFTSDAPIYLQIMDEIKLRIAQGRLKPGDKVPAVRELALKAGVNPNTMQKALSELEREGVLYSQRTSGRFVSDQSEANTNLKNSIASKHIETYINGMRDLGHSNDEIIDAIKNYFIEEEK